MADKGLYNYTVQEALNHHIGKVITVNPTIVLSAGSITTQFGSADEPVLNSVEIPDAVAVPGGTSRLLNASFWSKDNEDASHQVLIHDTAGANLGDVNPGSWSLNISAADFAGLGYQGFFEFTTGDIHQAGAISYGTCSPAQVTPALLMKAASGSTSMYFSVIMTGVPQLQSTTDMSWVFHIEYK